MNDWYKEKDMEEYDEEVKENEGIVDEMNRMKNKMQSMALLEEL